MKKFILFVISICFAVLLSAQVSKTVNVTTGGFSTSLITKEHSNGTKLANSGTVTDIDGNVYNTVTIGTQIWMVENLKTTKYNDGTSIPNVTDYTEWGALTTGAYCWYNNNASNKSPYGALYNWYSVNTGKLAPVGWHVPTFAEWTTLNTVIGGVAGKLKETGTDHWASPNTGATNETGFTALPGGSRNGGYLAAFTGLGLSGYWWSTRDDNTGGAGEALMYNFDVISQYASVKWIGSSVRCVKD